MPLNFHRTPMVSRIKKMIEFYTMIIMNLCVLGTILFALNGGTQSATKKVYIIDAQTGDILTFFDSNLVSFSHHQIYKISFLNL